MRSASRNKRHGERPKLALFNPEEPSRSNAQAVEAAEHYASCGETENDVDVLETGLASLALLQASFDGSAIPDECRTLSTALFVNRKLAYVRREIRDWAPYPSQVFEGGERFELLTLESWRDIQTQVVRMEGLHLAGQLSAGVYDSLAPRFVQLHAAVEQLGGGDVTLGAARLPRNLN